MSPTEGDAPPSLGPPPSTTVVEVVYPPARGTIGLRGSAPLSWETTLAPSAIDGDRHLFYVALPPGELLELKVLRNDEEWSGGRANSVYAGDHLRLEPYFDKPHGALGEPQALDVGDEEGGPLAYQVFLPPSYDEQPNRRYAVLYAQDGQSLWASSEDPFGVWGLDTTLDGLFELGVMDEIIVVGIDTSARRLERLTPVKDPTHGGGEAPKHLAAIVDRLIPHINATYRTKGDRANTAVLGSSLGGLFSFFAAWTRPDVFGKAACLSSSFWWADRYAVRLVQTSGCPVPRPLMYMDSGASRSAFESDPNVRDGFHHTRSMFRALVTHCYDPGVNLHRLTFTGQGHNADAWAARVAIPLQILFPPHGDGR